MKKTLRVLLILLIGVAGGMLTPYAGFLIRSTFYRLAGYSASFVSPIFPSGRDWVTVIVMLCASAYLLAWVYLLVRYRQRWMSFSRHTRMRDVPLHYLLGMQVLALTIIAALFTLAVTGLDLADRLSYVNWLNKPTP